MSSFFHAHSHSHYSALDGMARVEDMVAKVAQMGQPAMALTDHGNLAGSVSLYKAAKKHGIAPFPGIEAYLLDPNASLDDKNAQRYHVCLLATDLKGYQGLLGLTNVSHTRPRFSRYPRITLDDLTDLSQDYSDHIALLTGCYFGLAQQALVHDGPRKAENVVKMYASLFPHTFVEIQHHSICHDHDNEEQPKTDDDIVAAMVSIADRTGLPIIATQDSHYLDQNDKPAHCVVGDTQVTGLGPNNGKTVEWYHMLLHGSPNAEPGHCESCGVDLEADPKANVYRTKAKSGTIVQIPSGKWYARIRLNGVTYQSSASTRQVAEAWLDEQRASIHDKWLCKKCYHTRYIFRRNGGTKIVGRDRDGMLSLQRMVDVVYNGVRPVMTIRTGNGKSITSTVDHRHLTVDGWKRADEITVADMLVTYDRVTGRYDPANRPPERVRAAVKARGRCEHCGVPDDGSHQVAHKDYTSNDVDNLWLLCVPCHRKYDKPTRATAWTNPVGTQPSPVVSIEYHDEPRPVYDVVMDSDDHSWLGNGVVTHNSLMKRMVYGGEEDEFPGDSFHLASADWVAEHYEADVWDRVEEGCDWLLKQNEMTFPALDSFKAHVPQIVKNPEHEVQRLCEEALADYEPAQRRLATYSERLDYEMGIINELGMAGYFMVVRNYVEWCNDQGICIEARGSANGSLVCFLLGVTQVDPIKWKLLFDRFLSRDRIKPPDIDMDVEDVARERLMDYLANTFDTLQIGNWSGLGINDDGSGSVLRTYQSFRARKAEAEARERGASTEEIKRAKSVVYATLNNMSDVTDPQDRKALVRLGGMDVYRSYGVHASGMLLSGSDQRINDYVPRMLVASSETEISQFDQEAVEQLGYLKLDVLGQATLTVMRICQELIGLDDPTDFTWIPENDSAACKILREGRTDNGIFHFEAPTKARGGRQMGIRSTKDAVLATGLFMPGAMNTGQTDLYLERRRDKDKRERVTYIHPAFEAALKDTYGAVVFQEQVINIMRGLGMSVDGINTFFKVVKSSGSGAVAANNKRLAEVRSEFDDLCREAGIAEDDIEKAWESTAGFVAYGFNRAHATGYGLRSYRCAYLKAHYPLEFMTALLQTHAGKEKEVLYVRETRRMGIRVRPPSVQATSPTWTMEAGRRTQAVRRPLVSIKGVGMKAAESIAANAPYESLEDLIERTDSRLVSGGKSWAKDGTLNGVLAKLRDAGALIELGIQKEGTE